MALYPTAELGAQTGIIAGDKITAEFIRNAGAEPSDFRRWLTDPQAMVRSTHHIDIAALGPQVAAPHSPANSAPVAEVEGVKIDQAYIGACTGAKLIDLRMAAEILEGRDVAKGARLLIAPASQKDTAVAAADGTGDADSSWSDYDALRLWSVRWLRGGVLAEHEVCIASTARALRGVWGDKLTGLSWQSIYSCSRSGASEIKDPREFLR